MLIRIKNVQKFYGGKQILSDITLQINRTDRIGLVGLNGCGKSTFLNILTGIDTEYSGTIQKVPFCNIHYLTQSSISFQENDTLLDFVKQSYASLGDIEKKIRSLETLIHDNPNQEDTKELETEYTELLSMYDNLEGYRMDSEIERVLSGLGFKKEDLKRPLITFSGGEQRRSSLAKAILGQANLLILDEPTNHLDLWAIEWLESYLRAVHQGIVLVSHDRYFLNRTVNKVWELESQTITEYSGNYDAFLEEKQLRQEQQQSSFDLQQTWLKKEKAFIQKNLAGQKTKQAQSRRKALEKTEIVEKLTYQSHHIPIRFHHVSRSSKEVVVMNNGSKAYDASQPLFNHASLTIYRSDRVALLGPNGSGKTTFIRAILGEESLDGGTLSVDEKSQIGYFSQKAEDLDPSLTLFDTIKEKYPHYLDEEVRQFLGRFFFYGDHIFNLVETLSGGEKSRMVILKFILSGSNFLILDEPTNHLDIQTRESLAMALKVFPGTILFVSHDRQFIQTLATRIVFIKNRTFEPYQGHYSDLDDYIVREITESAIRDKEPLDKKEKVIVAEESNSAKKKKVNQFKLGKLEEQIHTLENEVSSLQQQLVLPEIYSNYQKVQELETSIQKKKHDLSDLYSEWDEMLS